MTRFKLPDILGGIEVEDVGEQVHGLSTAMQTLMSHVTVEVPGVGLVRIARDKLTEVELPLAEEPDVRAVELGGRVWTREGWPGEHHWESKGFHGASWLALNQLAQGVPIVPLVPDPVASAPELPFALGSCERSARVDVLDGGRVSLAIENEWYTPDEAERIAAAILRAAREARGGAQ